MNTFIQPRSIRYGITEKKKEELDALSLKLLDAQYDVNQLQAVVSSLTQKSANFQAYLATAGNTRTQALSDQVQVDALVQNALTLRDNSAIAFNEMVQANEKTKLLASEVNSVINKLIYSAEVINKLGNLIVRRKALNPLISDELVTMVTTAGKDANNAVALMLVALQTVFASQASCLESEAALGLEYNEARQLYSVMSQNDSMDPNKGASLQQLIHMAYVQARASYEQAQLANTDTTRQLNHSNAELSKATIKLQSLQAGFAAANAAALAS